MYVPGSTVGLVFLGSAMGLPDNSMVLVERMNGLMRAIRREADDLIATDQLDPGLRA